MKSTQSMTRVVQDIGPRRRGMAFSLAIGKVYTHKHTKFAQHVKHPGIYCVRVNTGTKYTKIV